MTGIAVIGDAIRSRGESLENKEPGEVIARGVRRFGGFGPFEYGDRFTKELEFNRNLLVGVPKSLLGPAAQDVVDMIRFGTGVGDLASRNAPGVAAYDLIFGKGTKKNINKYFRELDKDMYETIAETLGVDLPEKQFKGSFSTGGEVNIPNAPIEPDQRVDRMTGVPYDEQAGPAFQDEEDRIGFLGGGLLKTLQRRQRKVVGGKIAKLVKLNYSKLKGKDIKIPSTPKQGDTKSLENFLIDDTFKKFGVLTFDKSRLNKMEKDFSLDLDDYENTLRELFFTKQENYRFLKDMVKKNKNLPDELISKKIKQIKNLTNELSISDVQKLNKLTDEQVSKVLKKLRAEIKNNEKFYGGMNYIDVEAIINSVKNSK